MIPGFLLLGSHLGDPERKILSPSQLRLLTNRLRICQRQDHGELTLRDLMALGYGEDLSRRILYLLSQEDQMEDYLALGRSRDCFPLTRGEETYPALVRKRLGGECPGCFFYKGDLRILEKPAISLVGSRDLNPANRDFAREAGRQAALHGLALVSGNARGADREAQQACLEAGGQVISVVADALSTKAVRPHVLYLSQEDFDAPFTAQRALSRNHVIHTLGYLTLVAQCSLGSGGTWSGTTRNLQQGWSLVVCFRDGSPASLELQSRGAYLLETGDLKDLSDLRPAQSSFYTD